jgi:hypothetical protein
MKLTPKRYWLSACFLLLFISLTSLPLLIEYQLISILKSLTKRNVFIEDVDLNLFSLEFRMEKFEIRDKHNDHSFVSFEEFYINGSWSSLFDMGIHVDQLVVKKPFFSGILFSDKTFNFSDLIQKSSHSSMDHHATTSSKDKSVTLDQLPISFDLKNFQIIDGSVDFTDKIHNVEHQLKKINFKALQLSNMSDTEGLPSEIALNCMINDSFIDAQVRAFIFQKNPKAKIILKNKIDLAFYQPYMNSILDWQLDSAILTSNTGLQFEMINGKPDLMVMGNVHIKQFSLKDNAHQSLLSFPLLEINFKTRPIKSQAYISSFKCVKPEMHVLRRKDQSLNFIPVIKKQDKSIQTKHHSVLPDKKSKKAIGKQNFPDVQIEKFIVEKGLIHITDQAMNDVFESKLQNLQLQLKQINIGKQLIPSIQLTTHIFPHGKLAVKGALNLNKMLWDGSINITDLDISMIQPYLESHLNGSLESGRLFMQMDTFVQQKKKFPHAKISGTISLNHLAFREPLKKNELLVWDQFEIKKLNCGIFPHYIDIDEIRLSQLKAPLFLQSNGNLNWLALIKNQDGIAQSSESKTITPTNQAIDLKRQNDAIKDDTELHSQPTAFEYLKVRKVILEDSSIRFVDLTMKPAFQAYMSQLNGQVLGIDQEVSKSMDFVLNGKLNDLSPLNIVGRLAAFKKPISLKVDVRFQGIEVPAFTPYSSHYIGYPLDKGQLTLNLDYLVEGNHLISTNKVLINQLELGQKNDQANIPSLPLKFALALLKDREGKIQIDIPVQGNLDSLDFSLKNVILQTLKNLLERMITSPFSFLTSLYGYGEDLKYLNFAYGSCDFSNATQKKIQSIADIMADRPLLKLELFSHLNMIEEKKALKRIRLKKELELLKFKEFASESEIKSNLKRTKLTEKEYDQYLITLYHSYFHKKPALEFQNRVSLEPTLLATITVDSQDLEALALKRLVKVRNTIVDDYHISSDRIFIQKKQSAQDDLKNTTYSQLVLKLQ